METGDWALILSAVAVLASLYVGGRQHRLERKLAAIVLEEHEASRAAALLAHLKVWREGDWLELMNLGPADALELSIQRWAADGQEVPVGQRGYGNQLPLPRLRSGDTARFLAPAPESMRRPFRIELRWRDRSGERVEEVELA